MWRRRLIRRALSALSGAPVLPQRATVAGLTLAWQVCHGQLCSSAGLRAHLEANRTLGLRRVPHGLRWSLSLSP
eukprot:15468626-Alexandrium_andersonii.AAC.1